jgi:hypothetical protein
METLWRMVAVLRVDGVSIERYVGRCAQCGTEREAEFATPDGTDEPTTRFGGVRPSALLDAAEWLEAATLAETAAGEAEDVAETPAEAARIRRSRWQYARDAVAEAMKFLPAGGDRVPEDAVFSELGRQVLAVDPVRLTRDWMVAMRDGYETLLAEPYDGGR